MTQDDRMETITDPAVIRACDEPDERGDFPCCADRAHKESLGGDSESGTYNRSSRPPAGPRPDADNPWALLPDDHPKRPKQCGGCGTKWVDAELLRACERRHGDDITTPAPVGAAVALDLDAIHETICDNFTGMAEVQQAADLLVAEVRRLVKYRDWWKASSLANAEDVRRLTAICHDWRDRSETAEAEVRRLTESRSTVAANLAASLLRAEAEVRTLRARLAEVEAGLGRIQALAEIQAISCQAQHRADHARNWLDVLAIIERAALATTGEGE